MDKTLKNTCMDCKKDYMYEYLDHQLNNITDKRAERKTKQKNYL